MSCSNGRISVVLQSTKLGTLDKRLWLRAHGSALLAMKTGIKVKCLYIFFFTMSKSQVICFRQKEDFPFLWTYHVVQNALLFLLGPKMSTFVSLCRHVEQPIPLDWKKHFFTSVSFHKLCCAICVWLLLGTFIIIYVTRVYIFQLNSCYCVT